MLKNACHYIKIKHGASIILVYNTFAVKIIVTGIGFNYNYFKQ